MVVKSGMMHYLVVSLLMQMLVQMHMQPLLSNIVMVYGLPQVTVPHMVLFHNFNIQQMVKTGLQLVTALLLLGMILLLILKQMDHVGLLQLVMVHFTVQTVVHGHYVLVPQQVCQPQFITHVHPSLGVQA